MTDYNKVLVIHCHTSGLSFGKDITANAQPLTIALGVVDMKKVKMEKSISVQINFDNDKFSWNKKIEVIHGIGESENQNGETWQDATLIIAEFIAENFGIDDPIPLLGYHVESFHLPFLNKLLVSEGLEFKFDHKVIDLFPLITVFDKYSQKEMFEYLDIDQSEPLSSLYIIGVYVKIYKMFKVLIKDSI